MPARSGREGGGGGKKKLVAEDAILKKKKGESGFTQKTFAHQFPYAFFADTSI